MSDLNLTPEQLSAVTARGGNFLISAAAGSGKTRVLVERLLNRVESQDELCNINDFLIITYTKAAAAEMRDRIIKEITLRLAKKPEDRHLRKQMTLVYRANIVTVHAFCAALIRENAHLCGINPDFRVAEEAECELLRKKAIDSVLEKKYEEIEPENDFGQLAEALLAGRDDRRLEQVVLDFYMKVQSHPYPDIWMDEQLKLLEALELNDAGQTIWGKEIISYAKNLALHAKESLLSALCEMSAYEEVSTGYGESFKRDLENIEGLISALNLGWDQSHSYLSALKFSRLGTVRKFDDRAFLERMKAIREIWKKAAENLINQFDASTAEIKDDMRALQPLMRGLIDTIKEFDRAYGQEKRKLNLCDFNDLEHLALKILSEKDENGAQRPTELACLVGSRFKEILVDEYQDINEVQELIVSCLSGGKIGVFMVGDVKQSIYRFRLAEPGIFLEKYRNYMDYDPSNIEGPSKIIMSKNFRSSSKILDAVNFVFESLMTKQAAEMDYTERERLYCAGAVDGQSVEFHAVDLSGADNGDEEEAPEKTQAEAEFVAGRIKELLDGGLSVSDGKGGKRPVLARDIAILMRSPGGRTAAYDRALADAGIACHVDKGEGLMGTMEVSSALSFLSIIDNPRQDIPLISVLRSPMFAFGNDELALIRAACPKGQFYDALLYAASEGSEKCVKFLSVLDDLRFQAPDVGVGDLLWLIYNKTGMLGLYGAMPAGKMRRANLLKLYEYARGFEKTSFKGLFSFINYINRMMERGQDIADSQGGEDIDAVRIMSIHKSKGLEFPVVILADCARQFNREDMKKPVLIHKNLGVGFKRTDKDRSYEYPTIMRQAITIRQNIEMLAEELRVLYVGMTRAREKLIISCALNDLNRCVKRISLIKGPAKPSPQAVLSAGSMAEWLIMALLNLPEASSLRALLQEEKPENPDKNALWDIRVSGALSENFIKEDKNYTNDINAQAGDSPVNLSIVEEIGRRISWQYPHQDVIYTPSKMTATMIKGRYNDYESAEETTKPQQIIDVKRPRFITDNKPLTSAERGVAMHLAMQFIDLKTCADKETIQRELSRLVEKRLLTPEQAGSVNAESILAFLSSALGRRILSSDNLMREFKFSVLAPAELFAGVKNEPEEEVLLQGVIDCCFEEDGSWILLDFKTDRVDASNEEAHAQDYKTQLCTYSWALESITEKRVSESYLYFFETGHYIKL